MKTNIQDKELDALFQEVLPPEEYGEDSNVEELYNRIMDMETELEKFKVSIHKPIQQGANSGQLQQHNVSGRSELLLAFAEFLLNHSYVRGRYYPQTLVKLFEASNSR